MKMSNAQSDAVTKQKAAWVGREGFMRHKRAGGKLEREGEING